METNNRYRVPGSRRLQGFRNGLSLQGRNCLCHTKTSRKGPGEEKQEKDGTGGKGGPLGHTEGERGSERQGQGNSDAEDNKVPGNIQKGWVRIAGYGKE